MGGGAVTAIPYPLSGKSAETIDLLLLAIEYQTSSNRRFGSIADINTKEPPLFVKQRLPV
jgi:hypothetical protein